MVGLAQTRVARHFKGGQVSSYGGNDKKTARKRAIFGEKNEKMTVMRLSIECQKIPSYGSMATLRPFHFWEKLGFKSWGKRVIKVYARQGG